MTEKPVTVRKRETAGPATIFTRPEWFKGPLAELREEIDQLFEMLSWDSPFRELPYRMGLQGRQMFQPRDVGVKDIMPHFDVREVEGNYEITAEVPGLAESDIDITFADGLLTIKGEKETLREEEEKSYYLHERRFGTFSRSLRVPNSIDEDNIKAVLNNGILTIALPKTAEAMSRERKIAVNVA